MTKREAIRQTHQENVLLELGFTREEAEGLRRISVRLQHWYEKECGINNGCIERDDETGRPFWRNSISGRRYPVADLERGAERRLKAIIDARNHRARVENATGDVLGPTTTNLHSYLQTDPRGSALYILRPCDVPAGADASSYYSRGICVY
jgi:hypothetical protein